MVLRTAWGCTPPQRVRSTGESTCWENAMGEHSSNHPCPLWSRCSYSHHSVQAAL